MLLSCNCTCKKKVSLWCCQFCFAVPAPVFLFGLRHWWLVPLSRNGKTVSFRWHRICLTVPAPIRLFRVQYRYLLLSKILAWPLFTSEKLWVYTQPAINLGPVLKHEMRVWTMPEWLSVLSWCIRPLFCVAMMQNDIRIMLQKIMFSTQALVCYVPRLSKSIYYLCSVEVNQYSNSVNS